jgi:hypothetical protein
VTRPEATYSSIWDRSVVSTNIVGNLPFSVGQEGTDGR